jgi:hypothetical protein
MAERGGFTPMLVFTDNIIQLHNSFLPLFFITRLSLPKIKGVVRMQLFLLMALSVFRLFTLNLNKTQS